MDPVRLTMATVTGAALGAAHEGAAWRSAVVGAGRMLRHAVMIAAMIPCVIGAAPAAHAGAALLLFCLAVAHAPAARRDRRALIAMVDALAMSVLSVASLLCGHDVTGAHVHGGAQIIGAAPVLALVTVAAWSGMRWAGSAAVRPGVGTVASTVMVVAMAVMTLVHAL